MSTVHQSGELEELLEKNNVIPKIEGVQGVTIDPPNEPFARVIFRYRPRGARIRSEIPKMTLRTGKRSCSASPGHHPLVTDLTNDANTKITATTLA